MRILLVGTVPPPADEFSRSLAEIGAQAVENGDELDVLSPDPRSAAHLHAALGGLRLAIHLAVRAHRYDALILRIEAGVPLGAKAGRLERAISLNALGLALGLWQQVTLRIDSPMPLPGGVGGRATNKLWKSADRIVVANAADQAELCLVPGLDEARIRLVEPVTAKRGEPVDGWAQLGEEPSREAVLAMVRARAAKQRSMNSAQVELGKQSPGPLSVSVFDSTAQSHLPATGLARIVLLKGRHLATRLVKR